MLALDIPTLSRHHMNMRGTLRVDDDAYARVVQFARLHSISLGEAASTLIRRGADAPLRYHLVNGLPIIDLPPGAPPISSEHVRRLLDELP
jgi:hypothetical protein